MLILLGIIQRCFLIYIDAFICTIASAKKRPKDLQVPRNAHQVERVLILRILRLHVRIVLHEQVDQFCIVCLDCIVKRAVSRLWLLIVNIDSHFCSIILVDQFSNLIVISLSC